MDDAAAQGKRNQLDSELANLLFGDSAFIVDYMQFAGWNLNAVEQTGSNFGTYQKHDNPFLSEVGSGSSRV